MAAVPRSSKHPSTSLLSLHWDKPGADFGFLLLACSPAALHNAAGAPPLTAEASSATPAGCEAVLTRAGKPSASVSPSRGSHHEETVTEEGRRAPKPAAGSA